jgi:hypothetical protein
MADQYAVSKVEPVHKVADMSPVSTREELAGLDKSRYEWVEVPETDLFGEVHTGVSINFEQFGPGRHYLDPERAAEVRRLVNNRLRSDMRVLQPNRDKKMEEIRARNGRPSTPPSSF